MNAATKQTPAFVTAYARATKVAETQAARGEGFSKDAVAHEVTTYVPRGDWAAVRDAWRAIIAAEAHKDIVIAGGEIRNLAMSPADGAVCLAKDDDFSKGNPYTRRAFGQICSFLGIKYASNQLDSSTAARAVDFNDFALKAIRKAVILRCTKDSRMLNGLVRTNGSAPYVIRGAVSAQHPLAHYDDINVIKVIDSIVLTDDATARVTRTTSETWGNVELPSPSGVHQGFAWENSEVNASKLNFRGSITIQGLNDATIENGRAVTIDAESEGSGITHRLPAANRAHIAQQRIADAVRAARETSIELAAAWAKALGTPLIEGSAGMADAVLIDAVEETIGFSDAAERERFSTVLVNDKALTNLPRGTYAHVAGVFALMGVSVAATNHGEMRRKAADVIQLAVRA